MNTNIYTALYIHTIAITADAAAAIYLFNTTAETTAPIKQNIPTINPPTDLTN